MYLPLREINANIFIIFASWFLKKTLKIKLMSPLFSILHSHSPSLDVTPIINMSWTLAIVYLVYICFSNIFLYKAHYTLHSICNFFSVLNEYCFWDLPLLINRYISSFLLHHSMIFYEYTRVNFSFPLIKYIWIFTCFCWNK